MVLAFNKRASHDYHILEKLEAGIKLTGQEVKSVRQKNVSLKGSFATLNLTGPNSRPELWLTNAHISPFKPAGAQLHYDPERPRKLLLNRREINRLIGLKKQKGLTFVPIIIYTKNNKIKVEIGVCRGKKLYDKRQDIKQHEANRQIQRALRGKA